MEYLLLGMELLVNESLRYSGTENDHVESPWRITHYVAREDIWRSENFSYAPI